MSYFPALHNDDGETNILLVSTIVFGIVAFVFSVTSIFSVIDAQNSKHTLNDAKAGAYKSGQADQKSQDIKDQQLAAESPYRSYKAPNLFGNFQISFPKNWNAYVTENLNATTQVALTLHPDIIKLQNTDATSTNNYAFRAILLKQDPASVAKTFEEKVKTKKLTSKTVTVSGISSTWYEGTFDEKHTGILVLVPVRDKTMEFITDYPKDYLSEFNQILAQAKIVK